MSLRRTRFDWRPVSDHFEQRSTRGFCAIMASELHAPHSCPDNQDLRFFNTIGHCRTLLEVICDVRPLPTPEVRRVQNFTVEDPDSVDLGHRGQTCSRLNGAQRLCLRMLEAAFMPTSARASTVAQLATKTKQTSCPYRSASWDTAISAHSFIPSRNAICRTRRSKSIQAGASRMAPCSFHWKRLQPVTRWCCAYRSAPTRPRSRRSVPT